MRDGTPRSAHSLANLCQSAILLSTSPGHLARAASITGPSRVAFGELSSNRAASMSTHCCIACASGAVGRSVWPHALQYADVASATSPHLGHEGAASGPDCISSQVSTLVPQTGQCLP